MPLGQNSNAQILAGSASISQLQSLMEAPVAHNTEVSSLAQAAFGAPSCHVTFHSAASIGSPPPPRHHPGHPFKVSSHPFQPSNFLCLMLALISDWPRLSLSPVTAASGVFWRAPCLLSASGPLHWCLCLDSYALIFLLPVSLTPFGVQLRF